MLAKIFNKKNLRILAAVCLFVYIILLFVNPVNAEADNAESDEKPIKPVREVKSLQIGIKKKVDLYSDLQ